MEKSVVKNENELITSKERFMEVMSENERLKESYQSLKVESMENKERLKEVMSENEKMKESYKSLEIEYNENRVEVEKEDGEKVN